MTDIKPCPHCGSIDLEFRRWRGLIGIYCKNKKCPRSSTAYFKTTEAAIEGWQKAAEAAINGRRDQRTKSEK